MDFHHDRIKDNLERVVLGFDLPNAIELQQERKKELEREMESGTESKVNSCSKILPPWGHTCGSI
jgi:hypothetical protein